ncbi:MAG: hypothetical protein IJS67_04315 [Clostridia bacterium]|nr:hypothetical protein [Clostridia bacterium]
MKGAKAYAKVNLSLNVTAGEKGYHDLDSVVVSVGLYDEAVAYKREDEKINLKFYGLGAEKLNAKKTNAERAAEIFRDKFKAGGADIEITRGIPLGGGLGGSSADAVAAVKAMAELYGVKEDLSPVLNEVSSDGAYMLSGGFARMRGRGEKVERIFGLPELYLVLAFCREGVDTGECYALFDTMDKDEKSDNNRLIASLLKGDIVSAAKEVKNGLKSAAFCLNAEMPVVQEKMKGFSPLAVSVSGSGSTLFSLYRSEEESLKAAEEMRAARINALAVNTV